MPTREEVALALANEQQFKQYITDDEDFIEAAHYPEFTERLFKALVESTELFEHVIDHPGNFHEIVVDEFPSYAPQVWGKVIQDIQRRPDELFKEVIPKFSYLVETLKDATPAVRSSVITAFLSNHELAINYLWGNNLNIFFEKFPEFKEAFESEIMSSDHTLNSLLLSLSLDQLIHLMTTAYPEMADNFFIKITRDKELCLHFFYNQDENHLAKFVEGLKKLPEEYHGLLWEGALLHITPVLLKKASEKENAKAMEALNSDLITTALKTTVSQQVFRRVMNGKDLFLKFFYNKDKNHLAKFFVGLKVLPEQYHPQLWQSAVLYITPAIMRRAIKKSNPEMIESLVNDLIKPAIEGKFMTNDVANACLKSLKHKTSKPIANEKLKAALDTLEQLLRSSLTSADKAGVRDTQRHRFLSGTVTNGTTTLDTSPNPPLPVIKAP